MLTQLVIALAALNPQAPALTLAQARTMSAPELVAGLLADGHPEIVEAVVHPMGMEGAPGAGLRRVDLYGPAEPAPEPGFCRKTDYLVGFPDYPFLNPGPARPVALTPVTLYRLAGDRGERYAGCEAVAGTFFFMRPAVHAAQIALLRQLAAVRAQARHRKRPLFAVHLNDEMIVGPPLKDSIDALAHMPLSTIHQFSEPDAEGIVEIEAEFGTWSLRIATRDGAITNLGIKRHIPYPF